ncbi:Rv1733c family protein [Streptomyces sp. NPDC054841]
MRRLLRRAAGRDTSPLVRPADRSRSRAVVALVVALPTAVVIGSATALDVWDRESREAESETRHRHAVTATTVTKAVPVENATRSGVVPETRAQAVWHYPEPKQHSGTINAPVGTPVGATMRIWVDDAGGLAAAPRPDWGVGIDAATAGLAATGGISLASLCLFAIRAHALERRTQSAWERDWERVEPLWSASGH